MNPSQTQLPLIVGHRGAAAHAPENTPASFNLAIEQDVDFVEGDFWLSADNRLVCMHDPTTERIAPNQAALDVRTATLAELKQLEVGKWKDEQFKGESIPTLDEILGLLPPGKGIYIEIKQTHPKLIPTLEKSLAASGIRPELVKIIAFDREVISTAKKALPHLEAYWLCKYPPEKGIDPATHQETILKTATDVGADGLDIGHAKDMTPEFARKIRQQGLSLHFWTVNDPEEARHFISLGADSLTSDRPRGLRREIQNDAKEA